MIALIDYGSGNLNSVQKAFQYLGTDICRISEPEKLARAQAVILPGVGAFDDCMAAIRRQKLDAPLLQFINSGKPFLGICVGYQALFERSQEFRSIEPGLGVFKGNVRRFSDHPSLKIPQIGWNSISILNPACPLYKGIVPGSYVYFVHSFYPVPEDASIAATQTEYVDTFTSGVWRDNVFAVQFHPEKSQQVGLRILRNFLGLI
ncbi:MAG TPA: imidazole glycerol phosphate synthase subunit HisH [Verrucomicrobiota bacterium]|nr:imidazole glycerol phosphate synthase subunit HisH [Verrucomicrobiota bacterium]